MLDLSLKVFSSPAGIHSGYWLSDITALNHMFFLLQVPLFQWAVILVILFVLGIHFKFLQDISPPPILSFILLFILFLTALKISSLVLIGFFTCFFILITHAGLWLAAVCYVASCATDLSSGTSPAVGGSLCSLGMGTAPAGPPAPGRLHRSISWAGTVHHVCDPTSIYPPSKKLLVLYISSHLHNTAVCKHRLGIFL